MQCILLSEAIYHVSYAREPRNCLFIDVVMKLYSIIVQCKYSFLHAGPAFEQLLQ